MKDAHICGTATRLFTLCLAYIKHALLLQLEQKGKQCHQVKFLRTLQTPRQIDLSPFKLKAAKGDSFFLCKLQLIVLITRNQTFLVKHITVIM